MAKTKKPLMLTDRPWSELETLPSEVLVRGEYRLMPTARELVFGSERNQLPLLKLPPVDKKSLITVEPITAETLRKRADEIHRSGRRDREEHKHAFMEERFSAPGFKPSVKGGYFDASFDPKSHELLIRLNVHFDYVDYNGASLRVKRTINDYLWPKPEKGYLDGLWTNDSRRSFFSQFKERAEKAWSKKYRIRCVRPGWEDIFAIPRLEIVEAARGQDHFHLKVTKGRLVYKDRDRTGGVKLDGGGRSGIGEFLRETQTVDMYGGCLSEFDVEERVNNGLACGYLHALNNISNLNSALKHDKLRLQSALDIAQASQIDFFVGPLMRPRAGTYKLERLYLGLERLYKHVSTKASIHLIPLVLTGHVGKGEHARFAGYRAEWTKKRLMELGVLNPLRAEPEPGQGDGAYVDIKIAADDTFRTGYEQDYSFMTAPHEVGHMLGLIDEYYKIQHVAMVKALAEQGLLDPVVAKSLRASLENENKLSDDGLAQAAYLDVLKKMGLPTPVFSRSETDRTSSIMGGGRYVAPQHYATFWEALWKMTSEYTRPYDWIIEDPDPSTIKGVEDVHVRNGNK